ncbi:hypothetical protein PHYSODRAFT_285326 [Phytophthora sojae]|uniref:Uncharacterized protein n=1 Tax=Phytophthora sojae (strain P6497) TaxID=1094619 RepID=G4Z8V6_PHYSP|nr:hypothetical protein PHYSODRAFT_285326 [Phytophthora sojae]EGZ19727.1 hypothetical protein PHYSODRAFT_285326 [Phytophthora sojae]|eukprot:XP_009522444.1 hypothetical protein PHYSODRAFT_285326 [Phytophthora sojae]
MFSSWDLVRPRFWYPMSSLEQSMMELEHMADVMTRSRFPFDAGSEMLAAPSNLDDDDFFRDLPVLAREQRPATQHRRVAAAQPQTQAQTQTQPKTQSDTTSARDNDPNKANSAKPTVDVKTTPSSSARGASGEQQAQHATERAGSNDADNQQHHHHHQRAFSSYSFSNSSIVDDKGRRVTSTRRRYEDSTGRLKAVHERQIEGNKLRTTWNRMGPDDDGRTEAVCSTGTPEEFEALWQQTPFGEAQKKTIKQQQQHQHQQLEQGQQKQEHAPQANSKSKADAEAEPTPTPMEE